MADKNGESIKTYHVSCVIKQGEYEYGDSFVIQSEEATVEEEALRELAQYYAYDSEDAHKIIEDLKTEGMAMIGDRAITDVTFREAIPVTITMRGGVIQDIRNIPDNLTIRVLDYDIDGIAVEKLKEDDESNPCIVSIWENT